MSGYFYQCPACDAITGVDPQAVSFSTEPERSCAACFAHGCVVCIPDTSGMCAACEVELGEPFPLP